MAVRQPSAPVSSPDSASPVPASTVAPRVRFAPSPTGLLHVGGLRTALYNALFARRHGGTFVLRIEDTDQGRFVEGAEDDIAESLAWIGIGPDEGPGPGGPYGPYRQSERSERYRAAADRLVAAGAAYEAFDTPEEIEAMRARRRTDANPTPAYDAASRGDMKNALTLPPDEVAARKASGTPFVVRLKVTPGETVAFTDLVRGEVAFETDTVDDAVLLKADGLPTYHLANVVDDAAMAITHVIRAEEWLPSTPKHLLLYRALGLVPPRFAHLPLILSPSGGKLSKRKAEAAGVPVSVRQYREAGYEPDALLNFLALLGWNPGTEQELFTFDELVAVFSLEGVGKTGARLDLDRLAWFNGQYLRRLSPEALAARVRPHAEAAGLRADDAFLVEVARLMQERIGKARDVVADGRYFWEAPAAFDEAGVAKRWKPGTAEVVRAYAGALAALPAFEADALDAALRALTDARGVKAADLIHPTRLALTGVTGGPSLFELMVVLGRDECVARLRAAADRLG